MQKFKIGHNIRLRSWIQVFMSQPSWPFSIHLYVNTQVYWSGGPRNKLALGCTTQGVHCISNTVAHRPLTNLDITMAMHLCPGHRGAGTVIGFRLVADFPSHQLYFNVQAPDVTWSTHCPCPHVKTCQGAETSFHIRNTVKRNIFAQYFEVDCFSFTKIV